MSNLEADVKSLDNQLQELQIDTTFREFEAKLTAIASLQLYSAHQKIHRVENSIDAIFEGLGGRLSPKLVASKHLAAGIKDLEIKSLKAGFKLVSTQLPHLFEMETSILYHEVEERIDFLIHIPAAAVNSKLQVLSKRWQKP